MGGGTPEGVAREIEGREGAASVDGEGLPETGRELQRTSDLSRFSDSLAGKSALAVHFPVFGTSERRYLIIR